MASVRIYLIETNNSYISINLIGLAALVPYLVV